MQIEVLGRVAVVGGDGRVLLGNGSTQRHLLAILASEPDTVHPSVRLRELMDISTSGLRCAVTRLRHVVGDSLDSMSHGYALRTDAIDTVRFEELLAAARRSSPYRALSLFEQALSLWRGPAFAEFADHPWAIPVVARLEALRSCALDRRIEALIDVGRIDEASAATHELVLSEPLRERAVELHMRALALAGRTVDALRACQDHRRHLAAVGLEPTELICRRERALLNGTPPETNSLCIPGWNSGPPTGLAGRQATALVFGF